MNYYKYFTVNIVVFQVIIGIIKGEILETQRDKEYNINLYSLQDVLYQSSKFFTQIQDSFTQQVTELTSQKSIFGYLVKDQIPSIQDYESKSEEDKQDLLKYVNKEYKSDQFGNSFQYKSNSHFDISKIDIEKKKHIVKEQEEDQSNLNKIKISDEEARRKLRYIYEEQSGTQVILGRMEEINTLPLNCTNGGKRVMIEEKYFKCNDKWVQYEEFMDDVLRANNVQNTTIYEKDNENNNWPDDPSPTSYEYQNYDIRRANCSVYNGESEACLCPEDFYGIYCQNPNNIECEIVEPNDRSLKTGDCQFQETGYVEDFDGDPPCNPLNGQNQIILSMRVSCNNKIGNLTEKVTQDLTDFYKVRWDKPVRYPSVEDPILPNTDKFVYKFNETYSNENNETVKLISSSDVKMSPRVSFINWNSFTRSDKVNYMESDEQYAFNLTVPQMTGDDPFSIVLDLSKVKEENKMFGRYSVQVDVMSNSSRIDMLNNEVKYSEQVTPRISIYLDDTKYSPGEKKNKASPLEIVLIIVLSFIVVSIFVGTFVYYRRKNNNRVQDEYGDDRSYQNGESLNDDDLDD